MESVQNVNATRNKKNPHTLIVSCEVLSYSANDKIILTEAQPQGINPTIFLVDVTIEKHQGPMKGTYKKAEMEFHSDLIPAYKQVQVRYEGGSAEPVNIVG